MNAPKNVKPDRRNGALAIIGLQPGTALHGEHLRYLISCPEAEHHHEIEVTAVESDEERRETFRLRHWAYCGEGKDLPAQPDGLERDVYDEDAIHVLAKVDGVPVGTIRATFEREGRFLLETFEKDGEPILKIPSDLPRALTAEPSRIVVRKEKLPHCVYSRFISAILYHRVYVACLDRGMKYWVLEPNEPNLRTLRRLNWKMNSLGPPIEHHGQKFWGFWMSLEESSFGWELDES